MKDLLLLLGEELWASRVSWDRCTKSCPESLGRLPVTVPQNGGLPGCMVPRANCDIKLSILWVVRTVTLNRLVRLMIFTVIVLNHVDTCGMLACAFQVIILDPTECLIGFPGFSRLAKSWSFALASRIAYADWFCAWYTTGIFPGVRLSTASLSKPKKDVENVSTKSGTELELSHLRKDENLFRSGQVFLKPALSSLSTQMVVGVLPRNLVMQLQRDV